VAYSTPREAYAAIIGAFTRSSEGRGVTFDQSYGGSGDQSRAVEAGLPADVVAFSLEPDITRLVKDGLVSPNWSKNAYHGIVTDSVVVIVVRAGNPKHISGWDDLVKPGVEVITPNPFTSGGARWNVMAAYASQITAGKSPDQAIAYLGQLFAHATVQDKSARESMQTFLGGKGDAMLAYENEAIAAKRAGNTIEYVVPSDTILIENPVATVNGSHSALAAQAFVDYLYSPTAQTIFGGFGYRPVVESVAKGFNFPKIAHLSKISDFGGWETVQKRFFDPRGGIMAQIEARNGASVGQ
jgi:sulfate transport system substrate-binding protein